MLAVLSTPLSRSSVAASESLQAAFPSPFYFFDEIDARCACKFRCAYFASVPPPHTWQALGTVHAPLLFQPACRISRPAQSSCLPSARSLDTVNAGRVAEYIAGHRSCGAQYIVVSHKPQVRLKMGRILDDVSSRNVAARAAVATLILHSHQHPLCRCTSRLAAWWVSTLATAPRTR